VDGVEIESASHTERDTDEEAEGMCSLLLVIFLGVLITSFVVISFLKVVAA